MKKGMITFGALGDYRSAVVLCGGCHNHYDRTSNTGWVFLPTNLEWFAEWEMEDFARRKQIFDQTGREMERTYPTEEDFEKHLRAIGKLSDPDDGMCRGGLYQSYILEDMFAPIMMSALKQLGMTVPGSFPGGPKRWHGAPMAAINRGFVVTGAPEMKLPEKEWELLRTLQRLYSRKLSNGTGSDETSGGGGHEISPLPRFDQSHGSSAGKQQQEHSSKTAKESTPGVQGHGSGLQDSTWLGNPTDSAIDVRSEDNRRTWRGRRNSSARDNNPSGRGVEGANQTRQHKRRHTLEVDFAEQEPGVNPESWCFGPTSSSDHKINIHTGRKTYAEIVTNGNEVSRAIQYSRGVETTTILNSTYR
ncbi:hypothetical protein AYL99_07032 [Fonsecaea erecta]|uniref:Uncharacterized protein n=1 Tax=Fonsecaea erecta TaxID=1367422 RepID=A0A178ZE55_9EURO|nr:hypothetical protein AYL99_07032 [Fonsecaea erecta]OAP57942.1 hypothetical protein AYL99_07032 [Fonsecaea erecta]